MDQNKNDYIRTELEYQRKDIEKAKEKHEKAQQRRKKLKKFAAVGAFVVLFAVIIAVDLILDSTHMPHGLSIYGVKVSGLSTENAADKVEEAFQDTELVFKENGKELYRTTFGTAGISLNEKDLEDEMKRVQAELFKKRGPLESRKNITIGYTVDIDEEKLSKTLAAENYETDLGREESTDAYLQYDEEKEEYVLIPSWQGDAIDEDNLRTVLIDTMDEAFKKNLIQESITVKIDVNSYQTVYVTENEEDINENLDSLNEELDVYKDSTVNYTFGPTTETLDSDTILSWLTISMDGVELDTDKVWEYVANLADVYDTRYDARSFETTGGDYVMVDANEYGFAIDQDEEYKQLMEDIKSGTEITREPIYSVAGLQRDGVDDLAGSYIEVSLDQQHLWLYRDHELITETDIVSGQPTAERATLQGAWPIAYKAYDYTLSSDYYGYETHVMYWMPFADGQGLHDATWQSSFGGTRYQTSAGSHGCINLPYDAAATIYNNIEEGYPIIIYSR